jgi:hypothetical protein
MRATRISSILVMLIGSCLASACSLLVGSEGSPCTDSSQCDGLVCSNGKCIEEVHCVQPCPAQDDTQCIADILQTCSPEADGCLAWEDTTDCAAQSEVCKLEDGNAKCGPCEDACQTENALQCIEQMVQRCELAGTGCLLWIDNHDCDQTGQICVGGVCTGDCVPECSVGERECNGTWTTICTDDGCAHFVDDIECAPQICQSGFCVNPAHCTDREQSGNETDLDCGGSCSGCSDGQSCEQNTDCDNDWCNVDICAAPSCDDGALNQDETAVDCGGDICNACGMGSVCLEASDCLSNFCDNGFCGCDNLCIEDETGCNGTVPLTCEPDAQTGCVYWTAGVDCANTNQVCQPGEPAQCVDCQSCAISDQEVCSGTAARVCTDFDLQKCYLLTRECAMHPPEICFMGQCILPGSCNTRDCNTPGPHFADMRNTPTGMQEQTGPGQAVVTDASRNLMWQRCVVGLTGDECGSGSVTQMFWQEAIDYCENLSWGPITPYDDWVLPDRWQIQSMFEYGSANPIDTTLFPAAGSFWFWISATLAVDSSSAWQFNSSTSQYTPKLKDNGLSGGYVRCVRQTGPGAEYLARYSTDNEDDKTVTDHVTGLKWQRCQSGYVGLNCTDSGSPYVLNRTEAEDYCSTLDWGVEPTGWRLPTIKELNSIALDNQGTHIDQATFFYTNFYPNIWSSDDDIFGNHYYLSFSDGTINETITASDSLTVRCVHQ